MAPTLALHGGTGQVVPTVILNCLILVALLGFKDFGVDENS